jgi:uncharacterized protein YggT (Ycf19 family)
MYRERRIVDEGPRERRGLFAGPALVIHLLLIFIVAMIGLDTLFRATNARHSNGVVAFVDTVANPFLAPFRGMFASDNYLLTALVAVIAYLVLDAIVTTVIRWTGGRRGYGDGYGA